MTHQQLTLKNVQSGCVLSDVLRVGFLGAGQLPNLLPSAAAVGPQHLREIRPTLLHVGHPEITPSVAKVRSGTAKFVLLPFLEELCREGGCILLPSKLCPPPLPQFPQMTDIPGGTGNASYMLYEIFPMSSCSLMMDFSTR